MDSKSKIIFSRKIQINYFFHSILKQAMHFTRHLVKHFILKLNASSPKKRKKKNHWCIRKKFQHDLISTDTNKILINCERYYRVVDFTRLVDFI